MVKVPLRVALFGLVDGGGRERDRHGDWDPRFFFGHAPQGRARRQARGSGQRPDSLRLLTVNTPDIQNAHSLNSRCRSKFEIHTTLSTLEFVTPMHTSSLHPSTPSRIKREPSRDCPAHAGCYSLGRLAFKEFSRNCVISLRRNAKSRDCISVPFVTGALQ